MIPSIDDSATISLLTMINGNLTKDTRKKDLQDFCCHYLVITNCTCNIKVKCTGVLHTVPSRILKISFYSPCIANEKKEWGQDWIYYPT